LKNTIDYTVILTHYYQVSHILHTNGVQQRLLAKEAEKDSHFNKRKEREESEGRRFDQQGREQNKRQQEQSKKKKIGEESAPAGGRLRRKDSNKKCHHGITSPVMREKPKKTKGIISKEAQQALVRGNGRAIVASHGFGCRHYGIRDLPIMDTMQDYRHYIKPGMWLDGKRCVDCRTPATDLKPNRILNGYIMNYCRMGVSCEVLNPEESEEAKEDFESRKCEFLICLMCKNKRLNEYEGVAETNNNEAIPTRGTRLSTRNKN
jgi:hypothetical protein